jgi:diguanylate cyclase (GGDEF)-like protein
MAAVALRRRLGAAVVRLGRRIDASVEVPATPPGQDSLTGLPDRSRVAATLQRRIDAARPATRLAVLYIDLDDFKLVNDTLGHAAGDELLQHVAAGMRTHVRGGDVLARQGGDEFVLVAVGWPDPAALDRLAERLRDAAGRPVCVAGVEVRVGASIGIATWDGEATAAELLEHADAAMYEAKAGGRDEIRWHAPGHGRDRAGDRSRVALTTELPRAIERGELVVHWQPLVSLARGTLSGVEALVRWEHPRRGLLLPAEFIPFAEETGLVAAVDDWVMAAVAEQRRAWRGAGLDPYVGVNLAAQTARRPDALGRALGRLERGGDLGHVTVELTESAGLREDERLRAFVHGLHRAGVTVTLDDFGVAYSSLSRLREVPARWVKIDRALLRGVPEDAGATRVLVAALDLVRALSLECIVLGIETEAQLALLRDHGVRLGQGHLLGRPLPAAAVTPLLAAAPVSQGGGGAAAAA